jgi:hypothetical protein
MKTIAFYCLHYGKEYLAWSIRSIQDAVDEIHVVYSDRPSFGHRTDLECPDSEEEMLSQAMRFAEKPVHWHKGRFSIEGEHRDAIYPIAREVGADRILVVDEDEIWAPGAARAALAATAGRPERDVLVRFVHFWRSFHWVCRDPSMPVRIVNPSGSGIWYLSPQDHPVLHFGYAQTERLTSYKEAIHGHKSEWRRGWFDRKFLPWTPGAGISDVHPTCVDFWNPEAVGPDLEGVVRATLHDHPYHALPVIR